MKKFLLILLLLPITTMSQQGFTRLEVTVKPGHQSAVVNLVDNFFSEAKWKSVFIKFYILWRYIGQSNEYT